MLPAALVCGIAFAATQFLVSTYIGPYLTDILASLAAILSLLVLLSFWRPPTQRWTAVHLPPRAERVHVLRAWSPYILLVIFVLLWGYTPFKAILDKATIAIPWPGLDGAIQRLPPVVAKAAPYPAKFTFNILSAREPRRCLRRSVPAWCCGCHSVSSWHRLGALRATCRSRFSRLPGCSHSPTS